MQEKVVYTKDNVEIVTNHYQTGFEEVLIICPGWFMTKDSKPFKTMSEEFSKYCNVLTIDFRGHGKSSGRYSFSSKEILDLSAVLEFAKRTYKKINLMGFSLGGAISILGAYDNEDINKMIVVSAPSDFNKIENKWWKKEAWLQTIKKFEFSVWSSIRPGQINGNKYKPIDMIGNVSCPTLFIAGEKDVTVYPWHTKALFDKAGCMKQYAEFKNCYHAEDIFLQEHDKFMQLCTDWLFTE